MMIGAIAAKELPRLPSMLFGNAELRKMYGLEASLRCKNGLQTTLILGFYLSA